MPCCEKCWADAYTRSYLTGRSQAECYQELLEERKDNPCTPEEQRGEEEYTRDDYMDDLFDLDNAGMLDKGR